MSGNHKSATEGVSTFLAHKFMRPASLGEQNAIRLKLLLPELEMPDWASDPSQLPNTPVAPALRVVKDLGPGTECLLRQPYEGSSLNECRVAQNPLADTESDRPEGLDTAARHDLVELLYPKTRLISVVPISYPGLLSAEDKVFYEKKGGRSSRALSAAGVNFVLSMLLYPVINYSTEESNLNARVAFRMLRHFHVKTNLAVRLIKEF